MSLSVPTYAWVASAVIEKGCPLGKGIVAGLGEKPNRAYGQELARRSYDLPFVVRGAITTPAAWTEA